MAVANLRTQKELKPVGAQLTCNGTAAKAYWIWELRLGFAAAISKTISFLWTWASRIHTRNWWILVGSLRLQTWAIRDSLAHLSISHWYNSRSVSPTCKKREKNELLVHGLGYSRLIWISFTCQYCIDWLVRTWTSKEWRSFLWLNSLTSLVSIDWWAEMDPKISEDILRLMDPRSPCGVLKLRHSILGRPSVSRGLSSKTLAVVVATKQPNGMASLRESHSCPWEKFVFQLHIKLWWSVGV